MTISEQIREAALCDANPFDYMPDEAWECCTDYRGPEFSMGLMPAADLRTFMLLVAEALE